MTLIKRIYSSYAFQSDEREKNKINREIHAEMLEKYKVYRSDLDFNPIVNLDEYDVVIGRKPQYHRSSYNIIKNAPNLSELELALLCDGGNLWFGYGRDGVYLSVSED